MKRLFVAIDIVPDDTFIKLYKELRSSSTRLDKVNWVEPDLLHLTLKFIGETVADELPAIEDSLQIACKDIPPFTLNIGRIGLFGSRYKPRVLWFGVDECEPLQSLHHAIEKQMKKQGFPYSVGNFVPHLTLARINSIDDKRLFLNTVKEHQTASIQQLNVQDIVLYESVFKRHGWDGRVSHYNEIRRFPLNQDKMIKR